MRWQWLYWTSLHLNATENIWVALTPHITVLQQPAIPKGNLIYTLKTKQKNVCQKILNYFAKLMPRSFNNLMNVLRVWTNWLNCYSEFSGWIWLSKAYNIFRRDVRCVYHTLYRYVSQAIYIFKWAIDLNSCVYWYATMLISIVYAHLLFNPWFTHKSFILPQYAFNSMEPKYFYKTHNKAVLTDSLNSMISHKYSAYAVNPINFLIERFI